MKYKDIADKHGVSLNTVKSWKKRHAWSRKKVHTKIKMGCTRKSPALH
ncbi:phage terminase small subunit-related protein [Geomicrobium sp. JCM 19037]|nr:phage terminase small subunit-related protein [Geomicrobium sp. JCM 19037]